MQGTHGRLSAEQMQLALRLRAKGWRLRSSSPTQMDTPIGARRPSSPLAHAAPGSSGCSLAWLNPLKGMSLQETRCDSDRESLGLQIFDSLEGSRLGIDAGVVGTRQLAIETGGPEYLSP